MSAVDQARDLFAKFSDMFWKWASDPNLISPAMWRSHILSVWQQSPGHVVIEAFCIVFILYLLFRKPYNPKKDEKLTKEVCLAFLCNCDEQNHGCSCPPDAFSQIHFTFSAIFCFTRCFLCGSRAATIAQEEEELIREWRPVPLVPQLPQRASASVQQLVVEGTTDAHIHAEGGKELVNFASYNFTGLASCPEIKVLLFSLTTYPLYCCEVLFHGISGHSHSSMLFISTFSHLCTT